MSGQPTLAIQDPGDDLSPTILGVTVVFTALTVVFLGCRLASRYITASGVKLDDYLSVAATIGLIGIQVCVGIMSKNGTGRHMIWFASHPDSVITLGKSMMAFSFLYVVTQMLAKISALKLLTRIFTTHDRFLRWGSYFLWAYIVLFSVASILVISLQCRPFSTNWGVPYQCPSNAGAILGMNVLIAVADVFLIILPQPSIWKLKLNFGRRLGLSLIFAIGLAAFAVAVVRMINVQNSLVSSDPFYDQTPGIIFTIVEPSCVIICACMPTIPKCFHPIRQWSGWSRISSLVSRRTGSRTGQFSSSKGTNDISITATKSWHVLHSTNSASNSKPSSRFASTESTERLELGNVNGTRTTYVTSGEV